MNQSNILISAADTLFFRDGRPFTMGEDTFAESISFPPSPSVVFGALCSASFSVSPNTWQTLNIKSIWLKDSDNIQLFPLPKDLIVPQNKSDYKAELLKLILTPTASNCGESHCLARQGDKHGKLEEGNFLVTARTLLKYLKNSNLNEVFACQDLSDYIVKETKLGIGRNNNTRISTDGLLYRIAMIRPENRSTRSLSIAVEAEGLPDLSAAQGIQLGGEKKVSWLSVNDLPLSISQPNLDSNQFKIYLSTPALFKEGWYPKTLFKSLGLKLLTAAMDKPINIGGWDVANNTPKPMLKAVPAGTVYYVEATDTEGAKKAMESIHGKSISDFEYKSKNETFVLKSSRQGFGIAFIGNI